MDKLVLTNKGTIPVFGGFGNGSTNSFGRPETATNNLSTVTVAGYEGSVTKVSVTLSNLTVALPEDYDILLVSPTGQKVMLMSDAGGNFSLSNVRLDFDDTAATLLPDSTLISSGTYRPTDFLPGETLPAPAPAGPYSTNLSSFSGSNPNGVWSLHLASATHCCGTLVGWGIRIETDRGPFADQSVFELNGGTLITRGSVIDNDDPFVVGGPGGIPATWDARAGASGQIVHHDLIVGENSSFNQLLVTNGAFLTNTTLAIIGHGAAASGNLAFISGAGSQWQMPGDILVGNFGAGNRLVIGAGGVVSPGANVIVGNDPAVSTNNLLHISGGTLRVLTLGTALDVRGGTNRIDAGLVDVARLVVTNTRGQIELNGGTFRTTNTIVANGRVFTVGGGASLATFQMLGGTHFFSNNLTIATNGSLIGTGLIDGTVTVAPGGRLTPGAPIGSMEVLGSVILQGAVNLQIDKSGGVRTSHEVIADGAIFYNGTLNVTDIGTDVLAAGDRFFLFDATPYVGSFTTLNLPPLAPGLAWRNNLSLDGSLEVISQTQPGFASVTRSGTNIVLTGTNGTPNSPYAVLTATNVTLPVANWQSLVTNQFGASGQFSFTNGVNPNERQRYFRLRAP